MGTYAESLLTPEERVIRRERQHPIALILDSWAAIILWGATLIMLIVRVVLPDQIADRDLFGPDTLFADVANFVILVTLVGGIIVLAWRWWWWRTQEFLITNYRLVLAWGVLSKNSSDSALEKINDAQLEVSLLGRLLDYGTLKVLTAAPLQGADLLERLNHATDFKKSMMTAKHELQSGSGDGEDYRHRSGAAPVGPVVAPAIDVGGGPDPSRADTPDEVAAVLKELAGLRDAGSLSPEEYEAKKQELLGRL